LEAMEDIIYNIQFAQEITPGIEHQLFHMVEQALWYVELSSLKLLVPLLINIVGIMNRVPCIGKFWKFIRYHTLKEKCQKITMFFQHDNDPKHVSKVLKRWSLSANKAQERGRDLLPNLIEEWNKVLHGYIIRSIQSMPHRYATVVNPEEMATKY
jgi:hypothetical protein